VFYNEFVIERYRRQFGAVFRKIKEQGVSLKIASTLMLIVSIQMTSIFQTDDISLRAES
jgi:hypothetical protein